ncbi:hypothetical protein B4U79_10516 [Dinothrombium tinctorium]|uniref:Uncharacterized protein n=1 Tax=Dinothrombium tinctorium TaxID=1965070 RepID=A0A3S3PT80_9ACAR|nr:hypothetical protein B4U79_10516 [Dinothrombium tinctorium]
MLLHNYIRLAVGTYLTNVALLFSKCKPVAAKGGGIAGAAAGGGASAGADWNVGGNYTTEEMTIALIVLAIVMTISFVICSCQCYQKVVWELEGEKWFLNKGKRPMPPAPYNRDFNAV